jgi:multicomponent Na+:H+ antiporter subunit C
VQRRPGWPGSVRSDRASAAAPHLIGAGVFLLFGVVARRGVAAGFGGDPVPQALVITGIVVAFSATALAVTLVLRLFQQTGQATLASDE